jgi:hypothetical protein
MSHKHETHDEKFCTGYMNYRNGIHCHGIPLLSLNSPLSMIMSLLFVPLPSSSSSSKSSSYHHLKFLYLNIWRSVSSKAFKCHIQFFHKMSWGSQILHFCFPALIHLSQILLNLNSKCSSRSRIIWADQIIEFRVSDTTYNHYVITKFRRNILSPASGWRNHIKVGGEVIRDEKVGHSTGRLQETWPIRTSERGKGIDLVLASKPHFLWPGPQSLHSPISAVLICHSPGELPIQSANFLLPNNFSVYLDVI